MSPSDGGRSALIPRIAPDNGARAPSPVTRGLLEVIGRFVASGSADQFCYVVYALVAHEALDAVEHVERRVRVAERRRADLHRRRARHDELERVGARRDAAAADDRHVDGAATCQTIRSATGFIAGPDSPAKTRAMRGLRRFTSIDIACSVLTTQSALAPASTTRARDLGDVGDVRRQLDDDGQRRRAHARRRDRRRDRRVLPELHAAAAARSGC